MFKYIFETIWSKKITTLSDCSCGSTEIEVSSRIWVNLTSPNIPKYYCPRLKCVYSITAPEGYFINITIVKVSGIFLMVAFIYMNGKIFKYNVICIKKQKTGYYEKIWNELRLIVKVQFEWNLRNSDYLEIYEHQSEDPGKKNTLDR